MNPWDILGWMLVGIVGTVMGSGILFVIACFIGQVCKGYKEARAKRRIGVALEKTITHNVLNINKGSS